MISNIALCFVIGTILYAVWRCWKNRWYWWMIFYVGFGLWLGGVELVKKLVTHYTLSQAFEQATFTSKWEAVGLSINLIVFILALLVHLWTNRKKRDQDVPG